jgi:iron complex transport system permease protein
MGMGRHARLAVLAVPFLFCSLAAAGERRLVSVSPNLTEFLYAIGAGNEMAGRCSACDAPEEARALPTVGPFCQPDVETVLKLRATHLFAAALVDPRARAALVKAGVAVVEIPCDRLSEIPDAAETLGHWTGREEAAGALAQTLRRGLRELRRPIRDGRRVMALLDPQQPYTAGRGSLISDMFAWLGVRNAGDDDSRPYYLYDMERLAELDPDAIICFFDTGKANPADIFKDRIGWKTLRAVRGNRVYTLAHLDDAVRPGPRILTGLRELRDVLDADKAAAGNGSASRGLSALRELRTARLLTALLVGLALALSGCVLQTLLRNPLADPYILGVSGGASLGAAAWFALGLAAAWPFGIPVMAFAAAFLALAFVCRVARQANGLLPQTLILAGVMVSAIESSLLLLIITFSTPGQLQSITWWMLGNLQATSWPLIAICGGCVALAAAVILSRANALNALLLGGPMAASLGVDTKRDVPLLLLAATLATAAAVSLAGVIGFVGLVVPHVMRRLLGANHRMLLPASAVAGAAFVWLCDVAARNIGPTGGIPVGAVTALTGGPFFLFLLVTSKRRPPC